MSDYPTWSYLASRNAVTIITIGYRAIPNKQTEKDNTLNIIKDAGERVIPLFVL